MKKYRHGDLLIVKVEEFTGNRVIKRWSENHNEITLLRGEATGHAHRVVVDGKSRVDMYENEAKQRFFKVEGKAKLVHEEHNTIELEAGNYAVIRQRVYTPKAIEYVVD